MQLDPDGDDAFEADRVGSIAVEAKGPGRFHGHVSEQWSSLKGVHGGAVAAISLNAVPETLHSMGVDPATTLRAATFGYASGNVVGDVSVDVEIVRGRAMVTTHATVTQNGKTTTVARFHHSSDAPPMPERPTDTVRLELPGKVAHINNVETHLHPAPPCSAEHPGRSGSHGAAPARDTFDAAWLTMFGDYFPPAVSARATTPQRAGTIEYSI